ncbi:MAG: hypothetical protein SW833_18740 [Cyanobacteriota bacterium]|nr:hypothetical protein [Cyanobacteriota bacterium]
MPETYNPPTQQRTFLEEAAAQTTTLIFFKPLSLLKLTFVNNVF